MQHSEDDSTTRPELLARSADWRDGRAWSELVARYEPMLRRCCRRRKLSGLETEEVIQRVWIDLARRLTTFRYDPSRRFRSWLTSLCQSRIIDVLRERGRIAGFIPLTVDRAATIDDDDDTVSDHLTQLFGMAGEIQSAVRARVKPENWDAFWLTAIEGKSLKETSEQLGKTRASVFEAQNRVKKRLREEGLRRLAEAGQPHAGGPL